MAVASRIGSPSDDYQRPVLARIIHKSRSEVPEMPVMARKTTEQTAGVFEDTLRIGEGV